MAAEPPNSLHEPKYEGKGSVDRKETINLKVAAIEAFDTGASVGVVSKLHPTRSHSGAAEGGINAALGNKADDDPETHAFDTVKGSDYLADQDAVELMTREAPEELLHLEHLGVTFHRNEEGKLGTRAFGGASQARTYYVADITGQAIMHVLYEQLMKYADAVDRYEEYFTTALALDDDGSCVGAVQRNVRDGQMELFEAKNVILATGGNGQAWQPTTNALICTGDGIAMAYRAGAPLMDMEMIQYHPTTLAGKGFLITEGARGEGAHLLNAKGERFMETYAPNKMELASRDVVSRAEQTEINEGRGCGPNKDHIMLHLEHLGADLLHERLPGISETSRIFAGVDVTREPIPVIPTVHYNMGGIPTNLHGEVVTLRDGDPDAVVSGLMAIGEAACVSVHGANRLGSNSLTDIIVFGRAAARRVASRVRPGENHPPLPRHAEDRAIARFDHLRFSSGANTPGAIRSEMQRIMQRHCAVFRDGPLLEAGAQRIGSVALAMAELGLSDHSLTWNTELVETQSTGNTIMVALASGSNGFAVSVFGQILEYDRRSGVLERDAACPGRAEVLRALRLRPAPARPRPPRDGRSPRTATPSRRARRRSS